MRYTIFVLLMVGIALPHAEAQTILFDMGRNTNETAVSGWNNISSDVGSQSNATSTPLALVDSGNNATGLSLTDFSFTSGSDVGASASAADITDLSLTSPTSISYPTSAFQDSLFVNAASKEISITLSGFSSSLTYDFYFFGEGGNSGDTGNTWELTGAATNSVTLDTTPTSSRDFASILGVSPDGSDEFTIVFFDDNGSTGRWNTLEIVTVPEPSTFTLLGLGMLALVMLRRWSR